MKWDSLKKELNPWLGTETSMEVRRDKQQTWCSSTVTERECLSTS